MNALPLRKIYFDRLTGSKTVDRCIVACHDVRGVNDEGRILPASISYYRGKAHGRYPGRGRVWYLHTDKLVRHWLSVAWLRD